MPNPALSRVEHPSNREVVFSRLLDAPRELVWRVWSDPEQLHQWWGPAGLIPVSLATWMVTGAASHLGDSVTAIHGE